MTDELNRILDYATDEAMRTGFWEIGPDHILLAIIRDGANDASDALSGSGVDLPELKHFIESRIATGSMIPFSGRDKVVMSRAAHNLFNIAMLESSMSGSEKTGVLHVLSAIMKVTASEGREYLKEVGFDLSAIMKSKKYETSRTAIPQTPQIISISKTNTKNFS